MRTQTHDIEKVANAEGKKMRRRRPGRDIRGRRSQRGEKPLSILLQHTQNEVEKKNGMILSHPNEFNISVKGGL
jgi:hypothetical protein